ncbi:MAG TPA: hypothetical protein DDW27_07670, partial [Bacteroidales bacterium]|nr:hypothetical protein [Bacteroidales bacterium]
MNNKGSHLTRRKILKNAAIAGLGGAIIPMSGFSAADQRSQKKKV